MERTQVLELMGTLNLYGMRGAYDEIMATGIKRQHEPPRNRWRSPVGGDCREAGTKLGS
jgi:hypothetical protein